MGGKGVLETDLPNQLERRTVKIPKKEAVNTRGIGSKSIWRFKKCGSEPWQVSRVEQHIFLFFRFGEITYTALSVPGNVQGSILAYREKIHTAVQVMEQSRFSVFLLACRWIWVGGSPALSPSFTRRDHPKCCHRGSRRFHYWLHHHAQLCWPGSPLFLCH